MLRFAQTLTPLAVSYLAALPELLDDGTLDAPAIRRKSAEYKTEIAKIDASLAQLARTSPAAALLASGVELRKRWESMSPSLRSQVVGELVSVTILPCITRGRQGFNPDFIRLEWKTG